MQRQILKMGRHSTALAFKLRAPGSILSSDFSGKKISRDSMTAALLSWWTVPRLNSHSNPSSTGESSTAKKSYVSFEVG